MSQILLDGAELGNAATPCEANRILVASWLVFTKPAKKTSLAMDTTARPVTSLSLDLSASASGIVGEVMPLAVRV